MCGIVGYVGKKSVVPVILEACDGSNIADTIPPESPLPERPVCRFAAPKASCAIWKKPCARSRSPELRHRPHPLGHARPSHRRERSSSPRLHRQDRRRAQRHRRELSQPEEEADRRRPQVHHRNRHRNHRAPGREVFLKTGNGHRPSLEEAVRKTVKQLTGVFALAVISDR